MAYQTQPSDAMKSSVINNYLKGEMPPEQAEAYAKGHFKSNIPNVLQPVAAVGAGAVRGLLEPLNILGTTAADYFLDTPNPISDGVIPEVTDRALGNVVGVAGALTGGTGRTGDSINHAMAKFPQAASLGEWLTPVGIGKNLAEATGGGLVRQFTDSDLATALGAQAGSLGLRELKQSIEEGLRNNRSTTRQGLHAIYNPHETVVAGTNMQ